jgi:phosphoserine aminotransferase
MKIYNFSAGPSILPQSTIENTAEAVEEFQRIGLSF